MAFKGEYMEEGKGVPGFLLVLNHNVLAPCDLERVKQAVPKESTFETL